AILRDTVPLADGAPTPRLTLRNRRVTVEFLPELGGKIISLRARRPGGGPDKEFLSRSDEPYRRRPAAVPFTSTEFDGADEIFPTLTAGEIAAGDWQGAKLPDHGELFRRPWTEEPPQAAGEAAPGAVALKIAGEAMPYVFHRRATLEGNRLILDYRVENPSDRPLPYVYCFHPLFVAVADLAVDLPGGAAAPVHVAFSRSDWLGKPGSVRPLGAIVHPDTGEKLSDLPFRDGRGYYKFFSFPAQKPATATLRYPDGAVAITFDLPGYAIWVAEGDVGKLKHYGVEPTNSREENLARQVANGHAMTIPPRGEAKWRITLAVSAK
ncbi:MAG: aldose 1-epimerase, partial [Planctomycetes bacterium]|nr:aldose 1-epimerase [Planctomycetota bacterium]